MQSAENDVASGKSGDSVRAGSPAGITDHQLISKEVTTSQGAFLLQGIGPYIENLKSSNFGHIEACIDIIKRSKVILDIGANIGATSVFMGAMAPAAQIHSFEPHPETFKHLVYNVNANCPNSNIVVHPLALGREAGTVQFRDSKIHASGNTIITDEGLMSKLNKCIEVNIETLDNFALRSSIGPIDFIKVDVEGFEIDVLTGGSTVVKKYRPATLIEFNHWCLCQYRRMLPEDALDAIFQTFNEVRYFDRDTKKFIQIRTDKEKLQFLQDNLIKRNVDDLLCTF